MGEGKAERINRKLNNYDLLVEALKKLHDAARRKAKVDWPNAILNTTTPALKAAGEEIS